MKTKVRVGVPFAEAAETAKAKKRRAGEADYTACARVFQATFTDVYKLFAPKGVAMPTITARNPEKWNPLVLDFSWTDRKGEVDIMLRDVVTSYMAKMSVYAPPSVVCDSTGKTGGSMTFPRPEDALEMLTRMTLARNSRVYDGQRGFGPRPGANVMPFTALSAGQLAELDDIDLTPDSLAAHDQLIAKAAAQGEITEAAEGDPHLRASRTSLLHFMPQKPYSDRHTAFAYAVHAKDTFASVNTHVINLDYLRGMVAAARGQPPSGTALLPQ